MIEQNWSQVEAPSNIAILKYWGKKDGGQFPMNPSISFTLEKCKTKMNYKWNKRHDLQIEIVELNFEKKSNIHFQNKLNEKLKKLVSHKIFPFGVNLYIDSENTFPHSAGIASSASSMACVAKILGEIYQLEEMSEISSLARELSGSAGRSIANGWMWWGKCAVIEESSDHYAKSINKEIHPDYLSLQDWIFVCSDHEKSTSSSEGHELMQHHPYKAARQKVAFERAEMFFKMLNCSLDKKFFELLELECLDLHSLMMTSSPSIILLRPESLKLMHTIRSLRAEGINCGFTIDAGSTIHLIFPKEELHRITECERIGRLGEMGKDYKCIIKDRCKL